MTTSIAPLFKGAARRLRGNITCPLLAGGGGG